jgi:hypothetical protein
LAQVPRSSKSPDAGSAFLCAFLQTQVNVERLQGRLNYCLAKVGVERSNRFTRSKFPDIEKPRNSAVFSFCAAEPYSAADGLSSHG